MKSHLRLVRYWQIAFYLLFFPPLCFGGTILFQENFEDTNFASRGWYDSPSGTISYTEHISGSAASFECRILVGANGCSARSPSRHLFQETDSVYVSYYVKYSLNATGSHEFYILTNVDPDYSGLAYTHLTTYIEQDGGYPQIRIQDGKNIDETKIGVNLVGITENRALAGCNGNSDTVNHYPVGPYRDGNCFVVGSVHWNGRDYRQVNEPMYFRTTPGPYYKNDWHHVEAFIKFNTITNGVGNRNGEVKYTYDGTVLFHYTDVVLRTGAYPSMRFNQFVIGPWIGAGSPVDQTFWVDNLTVATGPPSGSTAVPAPPSNLTVR
jgi:hypothetical protein